ncbi:alpha/beta hydrolase family protein [Pedobacter cryotolerans]|uniref:Alpha/beta hydrolase n=1 Tax=Pedobacter cryotolerans TaxID=2571270 RepID=A0A4U1BWT8_9SPHI|nr:alpha/beta hydrolase [Pedobacter cryotolerans]TKB97437.1 alpha/beta hydrolase [Pedobacter cryotolerans]
MIHQNSFSIIGAEQKTIIGDITYDDRNTNAALIIFIHGFKGFKDWGAHNLIARYFASQGFRYLKFNLSHSGVDPQKPTDVTDMKSFAANTISKEMLDVDLIISYAIANLNVDSVFVIGHSRGGGLAILQAVNNPHVKGLITWSAISTFNSLWKKEQEDDWRKNGKIDVINARTKEKMPLNVTLLQDFEANQQQFDILANAKRINIPWLIVQGDDDVNVLFAHAQKLNGTNLNSRLVKIEGANHVYGASHPFEKETLPVQLLQVCERSLIFLNEVLSR